MIEANHAVRLSVESCRQRRETMFAMPVPARAHVLLEGKAL